MSATSLTFWFTILNCVMQARPPRAFPLFKQFATSFLNIAVLSCFLHAVYEYGDDGDDYDDGDDGGDGDDDDGGW